MRSYSLVPNDRRIRWIIVGIVLLIGFVVVREVLSRQPWPASTHPLAAHCRCFVGDRELTNSATSAKPVIVDRGGDLLVQGTLNSWDYPFTNSANQASTMSSLTRTPEFLVVFRQMKFFRANTRRNYEGQTYRQVSENGSALEFQHATVAPNTPGTYRLQVLVMERSRALHAQMTPEETVRPIGVAAEALVRVR